MLNWRLSDRPVKPDEDEDLKDPLVRANTKAKIFFSYTSNMVSSGVRETIRFLAQHKMVDVIVTSAGGIGDRLHMVLVSCFFFVICLTLSAPPPLPSPHYLLCSSRQSLRNRSNHLSLRCCTYLPIEHGALGRSALP